MIAGLLISLAALAVLFIYFVDLDKVLANLRRADYRYLPPIILLYLVALACRAMTWHVLLRKQAPFQRVFFILNAGYLLNNLLPLRLGEVGRGLLLGRHGLGFWQVFSSILLERAFDLLFAGGLLLSTLPFALTGSRETQAVFVFLGLLLLGMAGLFWVARSKDRLIGWFEASGLGRRIGTPGRREKLVSFFNGLSALTEPRLFVQALVWMGLSWFFAILVQHLLLLAFVPNASFLWAAFGLAVVAVGIALPSSPAFVGVMEAAWVGALAVFNVDPDTAAAYALVSHFLAVVIPGALGAYALWLEGTSLSGLYRQVRRREAHD